VDVTFDAVTVAAALGCGIVAGVFFAFSTFVMDGLAELPGDQGIAAMQAINRAAVTPLFMIALFGTGLACAGLTVWAAISWWRPGAAWVVAAGSLYGLGVVVVTIVANVPRNDALAAVDPARADSARLWTTYVSDWTTWNHVRCAAALAAAALLTIALIESNAEGREEVGAPDAPAAAVADVG
jgi:uncharacterized membrane protein